MSGSPSNVVPLDQPELLWPVETVDRLLCDDRVGLQMLQTWVASKQWVHRRVETIAFVDERRVRRQVSVDLTVPEQAPCIEPRPGRVVRVLPVAIMRKRTLVNFDLRDGQGRALMLLSLRQNQRLTFTLLRAWARTLTGRPLERSVLETLERIACGTRQETEDAWRRLEGWKTSNGQGGSLMRNRAFEAVVKRLTHCFLLFVAVEAEPFARLLVRYAYERSIMLYWRRPRRVLRRIVGVHPITLEFPQPSAESAQSYHCEIEAPSGVDVVSARLLGHAWARRRDLLDELAQERIEVLENQRLDGPERGVNLRRVNLHTVDVPPGSRTRSVAELWPERGAWLQLSTLIAWLSGLALVLAALRLPDVMPAEPGGERRPDAIVLLFVTYSVILEALLIKSDEHPLATRLLRPFRRAAAVCGLLPLVGSFLLVFWSRASWQPSVWLALGAVGLLLAVSQTLALWIMSPRDDYTSPWIADAADRKPAIAGRPDPRLQFSRVRLWVRDAFIGREASLSHAGRTNADEDFYGGDVWNQAVHDGVETAVRSGLHTVG
jgi:hypothetical protein